jgi:YD repeat-containing protein
MFRQNEETWHPTSWQLTRVINNDGSEVTFTYQPGSYVSQMTIAAGVKAYTQSTSIPGDSYSSCTTAFPNEIWGDLEGNCSGQLVRPVYLERITTSNSTVSFSRSPSQELTYDQKFYDFFVYNVFRERYKCATAGCSTITPFPFLTGGSYLTGGSGGGNTTPLSELRWQQLNSITFSVNGTSRLHGYSFRYSQDANKRLTLLELNESGGGQTKPPYQFRYNVDSAPYGSLPPYLANKTDHWGFFNNTYAPILDPARTNQYTLKAGLFNPNYFSFRQPVANNNSIALLGMLNQIKYPTGGITDFVFEQHSYAKQVGLGGTLTSSQQLEPAPANQTPAGGVRIRKISSYTRDRPNDKLEKEYFYVTGYSNSTNTSTLPSSGILGHRAQYYFDNECGASNASNGNASATYCIKAFSTQSVLPASNNSAGSHIGYSQVIEKRSDGGYTKFWFSNYDGGSGILDEPPIAVMGLTTQTGYCPLSSRAQERGNLLSEEAFNSRDVRVKRTDIHYTNLSKATEYVRAAKGSAFTICNSLVLGQGVAYKIYTYANLPDTQSEYLYDAQGNNPLLTTTATQYNPDKVASSVLIATSNGTRTTYYKYPRDYAPFPAPPLSDPVVSALSAMVDRNIVSTPIETVVVNEDANVMDGAVQTFKAFGASIQPYQSFRLAPNTLTPRTGYAGLVLNGGSNPPSISLPLKQTFTSYDARGNPLGVIGEGNQASSFLWGYADNLLIAKTSNALPNEVYHNNFESSSGWDGGLSYFSTRVRTGAKAGLMTNYWQGNPIHSFSTTPLTLALTAPKKMVLSGWIYSEGPNAQLWLHMYRPGESGWTFSYIDYVDTREVNKWVYLEKVIDVPADVTSVNVRLTNFYRGSSPAGGNVWFDDLRVHPADAEMTTYTHQPTVGLTSTSDANNRPVLYEYDVLNRLQLIRDAEGNIRKQFQYRFKN